MSTCLETPLIDVPLLSSNASGNPGCVGRNLRKLGTQETEDRAPRCDGISHTHHELDMRAWCKQLFLEDICSVIEHCETEYLAFRLDSKILHLSCCERVLGESNLVVRSERYRSTILLARNVASNRDSDDYRLRHAAIPLARGTRNLPGPAFGSKLGNRVDARETAASRIAGRNAYPFFRVMRGAGP